MPAVVATGITTLTAIARAKATTTETPNSRSKLRSMAIVLPMQEDGSVGEKRL
jgi:hypothetical protein